VTGPAKWATGVADPGTDAPVSPKRVKTNLERTEAALVVPAIQGLRVTNFRYVTEDA